MVGFVVAVLIIICAILGIKFYSPNALNSVSNSSSTSNNVTNSTSTGSSMWPQDERNYSTTSQLPDNYSSTYPPPTTLPPQQESTKSKIQLYNWDNEVKSIKERAGMTFYKIYPIQDYFDGNIIINLRNELYDELYSKFSENDSDNNFTVPLKLFDQTIDISVEKRTGWNQYLEARDKVDEHYYKFIAKLNDTTGGYYNDKIIDLDNSNSIFNATIEYEKITMKLLNDECIEIPIAIQSRVRDYLSLSKIICKDQTVGYAVVAKRWNTWIDDAIELLINQNSNEISFIRLDGFTIRKENYPQLIKLFEIQSKYEITIWFAGCTFESEKLRSFNWNRMISLRNPVIFDKCHIQEPVKFIWKYYRNQVDELTLFYGTNRIIGEAFQIENQ